MDALLQNTAQLPVTFNDQDFFCPVPVSGICGRKTSRAAANNNYVIKLHFLHSNTKIAI